MVRKNKGKKGNVRRKNKNFKFTRYLGKAGLFLLKSPYYAVKGIYNLSNKANKVIEKNKIERKRAKIGSVYKDFEVVKTHKGDYNKWADKVYKSDSRIGVIIGSRGSGKTAFGTKFLENAHSKHKKNCYAIGFKEEEMPGWIKVVSDIGQIKNDSVVLIDEGGILFNSRDFMSNANKLLGDLILVARHKNLTILFISQNSSNLDINILRQADFLILKSSSLLQKEFERKIIQKIYDEIKDDFEKFAELIGITYIYGSDFRGFVKNDLPSFWDVKISKSFR